MGGILHLRSWGCWRHLESYASHTGCWWKKPICWETAEKSRQEKPQPLSGAALSPGCFQTASLPLPSVALGNRCLTQQASSPNWWASLPPHGMPRRDPAAHPAGSQLCRQTRRTGQVWQCRHQLQRLGRVNRIVAWLCMAVQKGTSPKSLVLRNTVTSS